MYINISDLVSFQIEGTDSPLRNYLKHEYGLAEVGRLEAPADFIIEIVEDKVDPDHAMKVRGPVSYDRRGVFLHDPQYRALRIDFETLGYPGARITCDKDFNPHFFAIIIDYLIHFHCLRHDALLCHASAFDVDGKGILCPAWRNVGKTNLLLEFMKRGAKYIADDWVLIRQGQLVSLPKRLNLLYYNFKANPDIAELASSEFRALVRFIRSVEEGVYDLNQDVLDQLKDQARWRVRADELFGANSVTRQRQIDGVFALRRVLDPSRPIVPTPISLHELTSMFGAIMRFEQSYFYLYYDAVKGRTGLVNGLLEGASERTEAAFKNAISHVSATYVVDVPSQDCASEVCEVIYSVLSTKGSSPYSSSTRLGAAAG